MAILWSLGFQFNRSFEKAERQVSGAAKSGSEGRADAVRRRLHTLDTY